MALNYNALEALTGKKYIPKLVDNVFKSNPFLTYLKQRQKPYDGGYKIVEPIIYNELGGIQSYTLYDTVTYDTNIPVTAAEFEPKNVVAGIIISKDEELKNTGENQVLSMLESKIQIVEESLKKYMTNVLYGDGTGNNGKDITGIGAAISDTGAYGGIDRTTEIWWKAKVLSNSGTPGTPAALDWDKMVQLFMSLSDGNDQPDMILCGSATWIEYHKLIKNNITINSDVSRKMASLGFNTLEFFGKPLVADPNCPEGTMYFLNSRYIKLRPHKQANFTATKFRPDDTRIAKKKEILWTGNLTINNCRRFGKLTDISYTALV